MKILKSKIFWITLLIILVIFSVIGFFIWNTYFSEKSTETETQPQKTKSQALKLDSQKESTHISKVAGVEDAYFVRGFDVVWNSIEPEEGKFNWEETDNRIGDSDMGEVYYLSIIWPYANWDQKACHTEEKYKATGHLKRGNEDLYMGAPCNMEAYANFIEKVVERYDGDGIDDMPGLITPVKYWEILNEPSMQGGSLGGAGEDLKFFVGTPQEYFEILKTSYETIKKADSEAKVLHAGMAGMQEEFVEFWTPVFELGAGDYFDIANIHSISTSERTEDLFLISFKKFLESFGISDKPIWVTEAQYGDLQDEPNNKAEFEKLMARSVVFSLAQGADKIFMIENWIFWDNKELLAPPEPPKDKEEGVDYQEKKDDKKEKPKFDLTNNTTHKVYLNLVNKINIFDSIETIKEEYKQNNEKGDGATSQISQYKFINGDDIVYVLWGNAELPAEITGTVKVTDIYGKTQELNASDIQLSNSPIFVEILQ